MRDSYRVNQTKEIIMANIRRIDPFDDRFMDLFRHFVTPGTTAGMADTAAQIKMDVTENESAYEVRAEIPGVKRDEIQVAIDGNQVSITAEVKNEKTVKEGERVLCSERYFGKTYRSFTLAQDVDDATASAKFNDGVLELTLPKKAATRSKRLEIH